MKSFTQLFRFACVGILVTTLHVAVTVWLVETHGAGPVMANVVAFGCATLAGWVLNTRWSFARATSMRTLVRYFVVTVLGLLLTAAINAYCAMRGLRYEIGLSIVVCVVPALSFSLHRRWTYRPGGQGT